MKLHNWTYFFKAFCFLPIGLKWQCVINCGFGSQKFFYLIIDIIGIGIFSEFFVFFHPFIEGEFFFPIGSMVNKILKNWNNYESNLDSYNISMFDSKSALRGWMQAVRLLSLLGMSNLHRNLLVLNFGRESEVYFERLNLVMHSGDLIMSNVGWVKTLKEIPPSFDPIEVQPVF